jgi:hypothetical protein
MFRLYKKTIKPDAQTPLFEMDDENKKHFFLNYIKTKKFISNVDKISEDGLIVESISTWASIDDFIDHRLDNVAKQAVEKIIDHNTRHNIVIITKEYND